MLDALLGLVDFGFNTDLLLFLFVATFPEKLDEELDESSSEVEGSSFLRTFPVFFFLSNLYDEDFFFFLTEVSLVLFFLSSL